MSKVEFTIAGCFDDEDPATVQARIERGQLILSDLLDLAGEDTVVQIVEAR